MRFAAALIASLVLAPPVGGPVTRGFDLGSNPFEGGRHRGADLSARPGDVVRAPCRGPVVVAGRVGASGRVVTVLCGRWRVTVMPLAAVTVRRGADVRAGARVGTVAPSSEHAGLHLGVRRDGSRFGYVDPLRFLEVSRPPAPPLVGPRGPARRPPRAVPTPVLRPAAAPVIGLAPWPAWAGLALVVGGVGARWRLRIRARRAHRRTSTAAG